MEEVSNLLFQIYWALVQCNYKLVRKLACKTHLKYEIYGCDQITSIVFKKKDEYYIQFVKTTCDTVQIYVSNPDINLWNTTLSDIVNMYLDVGTYPQQSCPQGCKFKNKVLVLKDYDFGDAVSIASTLYHIPVKVVEWTNANDVLKYIKKGYKYIVGPSYTSNLVALESILADRPDVKFISPLSTSNTPYSRANLIKLNLVNQQFSVALSKIVSSPLLILSDGAGSSDELANYLVQDIPGSVVVELNSTTGYLQQTQAALALYPNIGNVFFSFTTLGQAYFNALANSTILNSKVLYSSDTLQIFPPTTQYEIISLRAAYQQTYIQEVVNNYYNYFYCDALYYQQQVMLQGYRDIGSLTGVIELDNESNRLYKNVETMLYSNGSWTETGIITLP